MVSSRWLLGAVPLGMPMEGSLSGAIGYCKAFELQHPGEDCMVVLVTDGSSTSPSAVAAPRPRWRASPRPASTETCTAIEAAKASDVQIQLNCETQVLVI